MGAGVNSGVATHAGGGAVPRWVPVPAGLRGYLGDSFGCGALLLGGG